MEPVYMKESRYSYHVGFFRKPATDNYRSESPESTFERQVHALYIEGQACFHHDEHLRALQAFRELMALILHTTHPKLPPDPNRWPGQWTFPLDIALLDPLVAKSVQMLKETPLDKYRFPPKLVNDASSLPAGVATKLAPAVTAGLQMTSYHGTVADKIDVALEAVDNEQWSVAVAGYTEALAATPTTDPTLRASLQHDIAVLQEKAGRRDLAEQAGRQSQTAYTAGPGRIATQKTTGANGTVLEDVHYRHDLMECLLEDEDVSPGGRGKRSYAYDPLYQLTRAEATEGGAPRVREYGYSNFMNLARYDEADVTLHYDDAAHPDRLAGLTRAGGARVPITHDANGNLLGLPGKTFTWNAKNELERFVAAGGLTADYAYDHRGIRVAKTVTAPGGTPVRTFFVGELAEVRGGNVAFFVRLGPARVAIVEGGSTKFVHPDAMGGTAFFTDAAGPKIASIAYRPFGNVASSSGNIDRRTYGVHAFDAESGLVYMRKRYYAPQIGRFLTPDPLATYQPTELVHRPGALHVYAYVANDPLNRTDHTGLSFWSVVGAIVGVIAAVALAALVVATGGILGVVIGVALAIGIVAVSYVVASATEGTAFGEFMRGFMIGFNAGLNAILASMIFGPVVGIGLGVINFLAAFDTIAGNSVYQGILGWSSWLMPMSWLATGVGLVFFALNVIPAILTGNAAFGSIFHFIGAIDENAIQTTPANAYSEQIADSHDPNGPADRAAAGQDLTIPMWA